MAEQYYSAKEIAEDIFHIYEPGGVYTTLIVGQEKALLIDTGYGFSDLAAYVKTLTDKPIQVLLTHGHTDHAGGVYQFDHIYMNRMDLPTYRWYADVQRPMIVEKFKRDRAAAGLGPVWLDDFDEEKYLASENDHFSDLGDGQIFDLGSRTEKVIFMPGHTAGSVLVYDDLTGLLFAGDNIGSSLWIFFDTSASLSVYTAKLRELIDQKDPKIRGIVNAHRGEILPVEIMEDLLRNISCIDPDNDKVFTHPRTGQKALCHKGPCVSVKDIKNIYVVYQRTLL